MGPKGQGTIAVSPVVFRAQWMLRVALLRRFVGADWPVRLGLVILGVWVAVSLAGPLVTKGDPNDQELADALLPPIWEAGGSRLHSLGTNHLGQDILLRIVYGARTSLSIGLSSVGVAAVLGLLAATVAAEWGGIVDELIMRVADVQLSIPFILLGITVLALLGGSIVNMIMVLILSGWVIHARVIRSELLQLREMEFVEAARAAGAPRLRIALRHLLPGTLGLVVVIGTLQLADIVLLEAALSFLGVGIRAPQVSLGVMLAEGRDHLTSAWWIATLPGLVITLLILAVNLVGDWMRDLLDTRRRRS